MPVTPKDELERRIKGLQAVLAVNGLDGALVLQNADLFYFTATAQNAHLYVPVEGPPLLLVKKNLDRAREESPLPNTGSMPSLKELPAALRTYGYQVPSRLGMELDVLPASHFLYYQKIFPSTGIGDISQAIRELRAVKSPFELDLMRSAARLTDEVFAAIPTLFRVGMSELELAGRIEGAFRRAGHPGLVRMRGFNQELVYGHLLSGSNMAVPSCVDSPTGGTGTGPDFPHGAGFKAIGRDEPFQVDYVGSFHGYLIDQTRLFVAGKLDPLLEKAFRTALAIQAALAGSARPGLPAGELYRQALQIAGDAGLGAHFMGDPQSCGFIGHGIGLELNELPVLAPGFKMPLAAGMTIALEPKFLFQGLGAAGIENTFLVTAQGLTRLGSLPDEIVYL